VWTDDVFAMAAVATFAAVMIVIALFVMGG
jgi:hypothetical protein